MKPRKTTAIDFAQECATDCTLYVELLNASKDDLGGAAPYINVLIRDLGFDNTLPLLLACHSKLSNADLEKGAKWLLVFVTRYTIILGLDPSGLETVVYALARDTRANPSTAAIKDALIRKAPNDDQLKAVKIEDLNLERRRLTRSWLVGCSSVIMSPTQASTS